MSVQDDFVRFCSNKGWAANYIGDGHFESHSVQFAYEAYQACAAQYEAEQAKDYAEWIDERNSLLAVIEKQREALQCVKSQMIDGKIFTQQVHQRPYWRYEVEEALGLSPDSVRLVEVGKATSNATEQWCIADLNLEDGTHKLYTIVEGKAE